MGTTTHINESSSVDNTIVEKTSCVLCFQWFACFWNAVFIGTHTPDFERVRTDSSDEFGRRLTDFLAFARIGMGTSGTIQAETFTGDAV